MLEFLKHIDQQLFLAINGFNSALVDSAMFYITDTEFWYPFYGIIILFLVWKLKWRALPIIAIIFIAVGISDFITSQLMKPFFQRLRPCHEPELMGMVHMVDGCGKLYGFASGHASNSFALGAFLWLSLRNTYRFFIWIFAWATLVSYSRVYAGEHYPGDVLVGAIIGVAVSLLLFLLYKKLNPLIPEPLRFSDLS